MNNAEKYARMAYACRHGVNFGNFSWDNRTAEAKREDIATMQQILTEHRREIEGERLCEINGNVG